MGALTTTSLAVASWSHSPHESYTRLADDTDPSASYKLRNAA
jgi:hypothetical protein